MPVKAFKSADRIVDSSSSDEAAGAGQSAKRSSASKGALKRKEISSPPNQQLSKRAKLDPAAGAVAGSKSVASKTEGSSKSRGSQAVASSEVSEESEVESPQQRPNHTSPNDDRPKPVKTVEKPVNAQVYNARFNVQD